MVRFQTFPKSARPEPLLHSVVDSFLSVEDQITSSVFQYSSNEILAFVSGGLKDCGFVVETDKTDLGKIKRPVLFGEGGRPERTFEADAFHEATGTVLEVEAGRGVSNYQFLKDLFQACVMQDAQHLIIAVRITYRQSKDYEKVVSFFETLYSSGRLSLPLESVTIVGY